MLSCCRFVLVLTGEAQVKSAEGKEVPLAANHYAYFPPNSTAQLSSKAGASLLVYERKYAAKVGGASDLALSVMLLGWVPTRIC